MKTITLVGSSVTSCPPKDAVSSPLAPGGRHSGGGAEDWPAVAEPETGAGTFGRLDAAAALPDGSGAYRGRARCRTDELRCRIDELRCGIYELHC